MLCQPGLLQQTGGTDTGIGHGIHPLLLQGGRNGGVVRRSNRLSGCLVSGGNGHGGNHNGYCK